LKKIISKAEIRADLELEISQFEQGGGSVTQIPRGLSGRDALDNSIPATKRLFLEPTEKRTLVPEVVAAIESRRKEKPVHKPSPKPSTKLRRRRKTIYDDFGEPLRTVWVEE
jgi:SutA-like transcriptional regulator